MKFKDIGKKEPQKLENVVDWKYAGDEHGNQFMALDPGREPSAEELLEEITDYRALAKSEELCLRHLLNTGGREKVSVKGLAHCPECGAPVEP
jgi:hypothetical protein